MPILLVTNKCVASRQTRDQEGIGQRRLARSSAILHRQKVAKDVLQNGGLTKVSRAAPSSIEVA